METTTRKLIPAISQDTLMIIGVFRTLDTPEKVVTKAELHAAIGRDPTGCIATALRRMLRDHGVAIEYDRDRRGYVLSTGAFNLTRRKGGITSMRGKARREAEKLSVIDFGKLTDPEKIEATAVASLCGAVAHMATSTGMKRIGSAIQQANAGGLPIGKTLALFHNGEKA